MECIFCKIVGNEIPSYRVYEDEKIIAFLDINPNSPGHTLIIPKEHTVDLMSISDETLFYIMDKTRDIAKLIVDKMNAQGFSISQNNGICQDVKHFHVHIIPKYDKDNNLSVEEAYEKITH